MAKNTDNYDFTQKTISSIRPYSIGIAAHNLPIGSRDLEVVPIEDMNEIDGEITDEYRTLSKTISNSEKGSLSTKTKHTLSLSASWLPISSSNRVTPPNIRRNERVQIYQLGDSQTYYWTTLYDDSYLRRLETVIWAFSNTTDEETKELDHSNTYFMEVSTHKGLVGLYTSKSNDEPFAYTVQLNTKEGYLTIKDDIGNYINLNSKDIRVLLHNASESKVELVKEVVNVESASEVNVGTKTVTVNCTTATVNASKTTINSVCDVTGMLNAKGGLSVSGSCALPGGTNVAGRINATNV